MSNNTPLFASASFAIGDPLSFASSKKPRRACAQQATSATRGGPASGSGEEDAPATS
jgi:hypothetical protein